MTTVSPPVVTTTFTMTGAGLWPVSFEPTMESFQRPVGRWSEAVNLPSIDGITVVAAGPVEALGDGYEPAGGAAVAVGTGATVGRSVADGSGISVGWMVGLGMAVVVDVGLAVGAGGGPK